MNIIFEDNHILAIDKPAGMLSQSDTPEGKDDAFNLAKQYIKEKYNKPGNVYLGLIHRLDRNTSGVLVFAKTSKAASRLSEEIKKREFNKTYLAIAEGKISNNSNEFIIENSLAKDEINKKAFVVDKTDKRGKYAKTICKIIKAENEYTLLEVKIETGRFHQIRAHLESIGHPLLGDIKYGGSQKVGAYEAKRPLLHALRAEFTHPTTKERVSVEAKTPTDFKKFI